MRKSSIILSSAAFVALFLAVFAIGMAARNLRRGGDSRTAVKAAVSVTPDGNAPDVIEFASDPALAPAFTVNDFAGQSISPANFSGKVVLLSFWATWCPPCHLEIPELIDLQKRYKDQLQIIGISMDDADTPAQVKHVKDVAAEMGINYPVIMANQKLVDQYGGVPALPTTFVLNTNGRVVQKHTGLYPTEDFENEIKVLLHMPVNAKVETFEDTGQIFLQNAAKATDLPGVDFSGLTPAQKREALKRMNAEDCTCGCGLTIAECRVNDSDCDISKALAAKIIQEVKAGSPATQKALQASVPNH